jgi:peroxiredoxin
MTNLPMRLSRWSLYAAASCKLCAGLWLIFAPEAATAYFSGTKFAASSVPEAWQMIGLCLAAIGIGLFAASPNPFKHWNAVLTSLTVDVAVPVLVCLGGHRQHVSPEALWVIVLASAIWWVPFAWILWRANLLNKARKLMASPEIQRFALRAKTQYGVSLLEMSQLEPTLIVFLRHLGCTFCREALSDLRKQKAKIESNGVRVALVHMSSEPEAEQFLSRYDLQDMPRVSDANQAVYRAFGLERGKLLQLFGLKTWVRGFQSVFIGGNRQGLPVGDSFQMPGVFLVFHGEVLKSYRHQSPADRPNYVSLALDQDYPVPS